MSSTLLSAEETRHLRWAGGVGLVVAAVVAAVPGHPGLACPLRTLTGVPCPLCGMTTSVTSTLRLDLPGALAASPAGVVAVVAVLVLLAWRPARLPLPPAGVLAALVGAMWAYQLARVGLI